MSHKELEIHMKQLINKLAPGTEFMLRDLIPNPPSLLGKHLNEGVRNGTIKDVRFVGKVENVDKYIKL